MPRKKKPKPLAAPSDVRRDLGLRSLYDFVGVYFENAPWRTAADGLHVPALCDVVDRGIQPRAHVAAAYPRGHAKTQFGTTMNGCRLACYSEILKKQNHLLIGANQDEVSEKLRNIIFALEENELLQADFGEGIEAKRRRRGQVVAENVKEMAFANGHRIKAMPLGGKIRGSNVSGHRIKQVTMDDPEDEENVYSPTKLARNWKWIHTALLPALCKDEGSILWLGTMLHEEALLSRKLAQEDDIWFRTKVYALDHDLKNPVWPEHWTLEKLMAEKNLIGDIAFFQEYMHQPVDPEMQIFNPDWWLYYDPSDITHRQGVWWAPDLHDPLSPHKAITVYMGVDPATGEKAKRRVQERRHDFTGIIVLGRQQHTNNFFILDIINEKLTFEDQKAMIEKVAAQWQPRIIATEAVAYQAVLSQALAGLGLPVQPIKHNTAKDQRIKALQCYPQRRQMYLPKGSKELATKLFVEQASRYPVSQYDDLLDAWCMGMDVAIWGTHGGLQMGRRKTRTEYGLGGY